MEAMKISGESANLTQSHKRYTLLSKQCDYTLNQILKRLSSKTIIQECFPAETFGNHYIDIRDLLIEVSELLRNLVKSELADVMSADNLEGRLNLLDEVIAIAIAKQKEFKIMVENEGWESENIKQVLDEELVNVNEMSVDDIIRFDECCNMKNLLGELVKRREFLDEVVAKLETEIKEKLNIIDKTNDEIQTVVKENVSKFVDNSVESSNNVAEMRQALMEFVQNELNFEEQDQDINMM
ncbi:hypothetical protein HANVADRAFT_71171 [Hanseniaspora valbyensis NRRL Y-1626]|uniref:Uncharacterized protein n=1 Tax=Hanseniaspora valbyensis NRRL Y-1626 TaxID=766949 RepID=A0A1B7T9J7_9ASCO|nr:hypothetical protein HANVADRAFT_71171 [Hanseniaspora valbyensis NRRL Y-1626]